MPTWAWVLCSILAVLGLLALVLALFRFRYHFEWRGVWEPSPVHLFGNSEGSVILQFGFPGLMRTMEPFKEKTWSIGDLIPDDDDVLDPEDIPKPADKPPEGKNEEEPNESEDSGDRKPAVAPEPVNRFSGPSLEKKEAPAFVNPETRRPEAVRKTPPEGSAKEKEKAEKARTAKSKKRRALFRLVTDGPTWGSLARYGLRVVRMLLGLLKPRVEAAIGGLEPATLGRLAGKWYAVRPLLPLGDAEMNFRFQDRHPSLWVKVEGGFSALSLLGFGIKLLVTFPSLPLAGRAFQSWRRHHLTGWRGWVYRKLQARR